MKTKYTYAFDEANRLILRDPANSLRPLHILEGSASTDRHNRLLYRVEKSGTQDGYVGPHRINLDGTWALTRAHELALTLHEAERDGRQTLYLKGAVVKAKANALIFALQRHAQDDLRTTQQLSLFGRWAADASNRLNFLVENADGSQDRLTLQGGWDVGARHGLLYRYRQQSGGRQRSAVREVVFDGSWDITSSDRLVYRLAGASDSTFEFKASLQSPALQARDGRIVYQVGIGLSGGRTRTKRIALFGRWKLHKDASVSFEIPYPEGRRAAITFKATYAFNKQDELTCELLNRRRQRLGLSVTFSRRWLEDARWFVRARKEGQDAEALAGVQVRF